MPRTLSTAIALLLAAAGALAAPDPGRYDAELCVAVTGAARQCGPVRVDVFARDRLSVRLADIVYLLQLHSSQVEIVLMHGTMQIDGFVAPYEWLDRTLQFDDLEKRTRYELRLSAGPAAR